MGWSEAAQVAQVIAVPVTALGIIVSLSIGIGTLRELKAERLHRVRPILRFPNGGQVIPVDAIELQPFARLRTAVRSFTHKK